MREDDNPMKQWHTLSAEQCAAETGTHTEGLSAAQAAHRLQTYGHNALTPPPGKSLLRRFLAQFRDFMVIILLLAAAVSFLTSWVQGDADYIDSIIILLIVNVNAVIGLVQEDRAEKALTALQDLSAPLAKVERDGRRLQVPAQDLVPGDLVLLEAGDLVPADIRLTQAVNLRAQESALTGESKAVFKDERVLCRAETPLGDRRNLCFAATSIAAGHGRGIVVATGMQTQMGHIARMLTAQEPPQTPLQKKLEATGKVLGIGALALCGVIFLMGLVQGTQPLDMLLTSISLAVAAIPEGLPAVVTIVLAAGMRRMADRKAIVRHMMAVETLGSASVICSDKTGTLTQNHMTVTELRDASGKIPVHTPRGRRLLEAAALCTNCTVDGSHVFGEATETALCEAAGSKAMLDRQFPRVREVPFSSARKRMTVVVRLPDGRFRVIVKGAPDVLEPLCRTGCAPRQNHEMAARALRVLAVAVKELPALSGVTDAALESGLQFLGLIGMEDPPRPEVREAVRLCRCAGIRPVMITGDHADTAAAIARTLGILTDGKVLTGPELDAMPQDRLTKQIYAYSVFARVSPEHKVRIVQAFQTRGEVVAMTGDGVNDAPALKAADIGCAMGRSGTDVAKGAADMILADDNFATIVEAVREGRGIYSNIRRTIHFLLSCNVGELLAVFTSFLLRLPLPLVAIQLLWVNLVTDSFPALALGVEPIDRGVMEKKPIRRGSSIFAHGLGWSILVEGCLIGALSLLAYTIGRVFFDANPASPVIGRTMGFAVLSLSQLAHAYNMRSDTHSLFEPGRPKNRKLTAATIACAAAMAAVVAVPSLAAVFKTAVLSPLQWLVTLALSVCPIAIVELEKGIQRGIHGHPQGAQKPLQKKKTSAGSAEAKRTEAS